MPSCSIWCSLPSSTRPTTRRNSSSTLRGLNDGPVVENPIDDVEANEDDEDTVLDIGGTFSDVDAHDTLTLTLAGNTNPTLVFATIVDGDLTLDYLPDQYGTPGTHGAGSGAPEAERRRT